MCVYLCICVCVSMYVRQCYDRVGLNKFIRLPTAFVKSLMKSQMQLYYCACFSFLVNFFVFILICSTMCVPKWGQRAWSDVGLFSRQTTSLSRAGSKFNVPRQRSDLYRSGCTRYADSPSWVSYTFSSLMFPCLIK